MEKSASMTGAEEFRLPNRSRSPTKCHDNPLYRSMQTLRTSKGSRDRQLPENHIVGLEAQRLLAIECMSRARRDPRRGCPRTNARAGAIFSSDNRPRAARAARDGVTADGLARAKKAF